ncbi:MAG: hypothetical protein HDR06_18750 [Lachnospiraceae bacterium]|nr:hypothetical protein [Lachnospiraceae bacterium]
MEDFYAGNIIIDGTTYLFYFADYKIVITGDRAENQMLSYRKIKTFIGGDWWINVCDFENRYLAIKVDNIDYVLLNKCALSVEGYFVTRSFEKGNKVPDSVRFRSICIRNDIIDYMFRNDNKYLEDVIYLLNNWNEYQLNIPEPKEKYSPIDLQINGEKYNMKFKVMVQGSTAPFPFNINHAIIVSSDNNGTFKDAWYIVKLIRLFLKFISQSGGVNFKEQIYVYQDDINDSRTFLYLRNEENANIIRERVLEYADVEVGIDKLITSIDNNGILFRSLFPTDKEMIFYSDIMNICAAFESQAPDFAGNEQKNVRRKMVKKLKDLRSEFAENELEYFDDIIEGFNKYKDTLKQRIELALNEFIEIYGSENVKYNFLTNYEEMPERIKNSRNALDHGDREKRLSNNEYWDAELLRAIVYMMILKEAGIDGESLKHSLDKLSRVPH